MAATGSMMPASPQRKASGPSRSPSQAGLGHGIGIGSTSGAGMWLANGDYSSVSQTLAREAEASSSSSSSSSDSPATYSPGRPPRTYHIQADAATVSAHASGMGVTEWDLLSRGIGRPRDASRNSDEPVDLDLSFDFVSQLEASKKHVHRPGVDAPAVESISPARPRGMSASTSTSRKKPPNPLSLLKKASKVNFSSSTGSNDTSGPPSSSTLPLEPLSATRRGVDAGLSTPSSANAIGRARSRTLSVSQPPPTQAPTAPLPPLPSPTEAAAPPTASGAVASDLVRQQRNQRAEQQLKERMQRASYQRQPASPKMPLATPAMPSFNLVQPPQAPRKASASSSKAGAGAKDQLDAPNALGLDGVPPLSPTPCAAAADDLVSSPTVEAPRGLNASQAEASPMTDNASTPGTMFSSLFEGRSGGPGSEISRATSVAGERHGASSTPGKLLEHGGGVPMSRGNTAPVDVAIDEEDEDSAAARRRHPVNQGLSRSETADWIRAQAEAAAAAAAAAAAPKHEPRERQQTATSYETASSGVSAGEVRQLVLSTSSSSSQDEVAPLPFLRRSSDATAAAKTGPWPQSPLLLQDPTFPPKDEPAKLQPSESGVGLGLFFGEGVESEDVPQRDSKLNSVLTIGDTRPESGTLDPLPELLASVEQQPSSFAIRHAQVVTRHHAQILPSGSVSSSVDGFACNVTPSLPQGPVEEESEAATSSRFGSKLWKVVVEGHGRERKSSGPGETPQSPGIRQLTLVKRNEAEVKRSQRESSARRHSVDLSKLVAGKALDAPSEAAPMTAPLPDAPRFPTTAAVPTAFESSRRSSKHVRRLSRLQYITDNRKEVRLEMPAGSQDEELAGLKSPRPAPSPSGETPDMLYGHPRSRLSWGLTPAQQSSSRSSSPLSPLLDFHEDQRGLRATQERAELLQKANSSIHRTTASLDGGEAPSSSSSLRRRSGLDRPVSMSSPAPTATIRPFSLRNGGNKRASLQAEIASRDGVKLAHVEEEEQETVLRNLRALGEEEDAPRMSVFVPLTTLQAHLRNKRIANLQARAGIEPSMKRNTRVAAGAQQPSRPLLAAGSNLQYSAGKLLDVDQPARALFFAGFLCMPWLWLIGGWWLANDGAMLTPGAERVEFWRHQPSMERAAKKAREQEQSPVVQPTERFARVPSPEPDRLDGHGHGYGPSAASSGTFSELSLHTAQSQPTHDSQSSLALPRSHDNHRSHPRPPRVLLQGDTAKVPRRSLRGTMNPHPEVSLFQSPVRTSTIPMGGVTSVEDLAGMSSRVSRRPFASSALASQQELDDSEQDDSGVDVSHLDESTAHNTERETEYEEHQSPPKKAASSSLYLPSQRRATYRGSMLFDVVDGTVLRPEDTNFMQRLSATEKYVLMNRFMAIVATLSAFAGMGVALNAVATGF